YAAAAVVLLAIAAGVYFMRSEQESAHDFEPGGNRATLTLADGTKVDLSSAQDGIIIGDGIMYMDGSKILDDRQQTTDNRHNSVKESLMSNVSRLMSLTTPKGGTYQIVLP